MDMVKVGCKLPNGLWLEIITKSSNLAPAPQGPRIRLKGTNEIMKGVNPLVRDAAYTEVEKGFWSEWLKRNKDMEAVKSGFIFEVASFEQAASESKDRIGLKTGLEPLNPRKPPKDVEADAARLTDAERKAPALTDAAAA